MGESLNPLAAQALLRGYVLIAKPFLRAKSMCKYY